MDLLLPPGKKIYCFVSPKQNILTDLYISSFTSFFLELTVMECVSKENPCFWVLVCLFVASVHLVSLFFVVYLGFLCFALVFFLSYFCKCT